MTKQGIDCTQLERLLAVGRWQEADQETIKVMLKAVNRQNTLSSVNLQQLPCEDLHNIDRLWRKYSNERFGFSVQARIFQEEEQIYYKFCERVGWQRNGEWIGYNQLEWRLNAPVGHLPHTQGRYLFPTEGIMTSLRLNSFVLNLGDFTFGKVVTEPTIISVLSQRLADCRIREEETIRVPQSPSLQEPVNLVGSQRKQFCEALIDAFRSKTDLEMMLSYELDWKLNQIAYGDNYQQIAFKLIDYAEARGQLIQLLEAAKRANPGNPKLRNFHF
ncbi:hypothetical protein NUACC21_41600 [Scytonema sp. NUACC21]